MKATLSEILYTMENESTDRNAAYYGREAAKRDAADAHLPYDPSDGIIVERAAYSWETYCKLWEIESIPTRRELFERYVALHTRYIVVFTRTYVRTVRELKRINGSSPNRVTIGG